MLKSTVTGSILSRFIYSFPVVVFVLMGLIVLHPEIGRAQGCEVSITKEGISGDPTVFPFVTTGADVDEFGLENGESEGLVILGGVTATVVEELPDGWALRGVECVDVEGATITNIKNGIEIFCSPNSGHAACTFLNVPQEQIPTLSEWGMMAAAAGLGLVGVFFAVRRRKVSAV